VNATTIKRACVDCPMMISRISPDEWSGSAKIRARGSANRQRFLECDAVLRDIRGRLGRVPLELLTHRPIRSLPRSLYTARHASGC
jgi:hypothetical protein